MKNARMRTFAILTMSVLFTLSLVMGCSSSSSTDLPKDLSGTWQRAKGDGNVEIHLAKEPMSVTMDGKTYPASITKVDNGSYSLHIKVENDGGQPEEWILRQVWNDNGSDYSLALIHGGTHEKLVSKQHS
jgi:hypothetical protein